MPLSIQDVAAIADDTFRHKKDGTALVVRVQEDAVTALTHVASSSTALSIGQRAKALDNIIGIIGDDSKAQVMIEEHVPEAVQVEILSKWGDRPSALAQVASPTVLANSFHELLSYDPTDGDGKSAAVAAIRSLALSNHDRADWDEVLDQLVDEYTIRDLLIAAVSIEVDPTNDDGLRPLDAWVNVGLDPDESEVRLRELDEDLLDGLTESSLLRARLNMSKTRDAVGLPSEAEGDAEDV